MSSKEEKKSAAASYALPASWQNHWKIAAAVAVLGVLGAGAGFAADPKRFAFSWLFAFATFLMPALGMLFFVLIQRLTSANWSVTVRRTAETFGYGVVVFPLLFVPVLAGMPHLFPWLADHGHHGGGGEHGDAHSSVSVFEREAKADLAPGPGPDERRPAAAHDPHAAAPHAAAPHAAEPAHAEHGDAHHAVPTHAAGADAPEHAAPDHADHAAPAAHGGHGDLPDPHALAHGKLIEGKKPYLNKNFFLLRALLYFAIWVFLGARLLGLSTAQDGTKDAALTLRAQRLAPVGIMLFALTVTFAGIDWIMSLDPAWFSTIFGVYLFATTVVSSLALIIVVTLQLREAGKLQDVITVEHYHDLGKLMFGFNVFWAYIGFSQFMLIWYAALPEEVTWYHARWDNGPWATVSLVNLIGHFVVPFLFLISRNVKRNLPLLKIGSLLLLVMHVVDIYWFVMPNYGQDGFAFHWLDLACLLAVGGAYFAVVFFRMGKHPVIPTGDPRLPRSIAFQNA